MSWLVQILLLALLALARGDQGERKDDFDWTGFILGSSCSLETLLPGGEYDQAAANHCGDCFDHLAAGEAVEGLRNCSLSHLPRMAARCAGELEVEESLERLWEGVMGCFYGYVMEKDVGGRVQRDVKAWMKLQTEGNKKMWEFIIGSSCLVEAQKTDIIQAKRCGDCFEQVRQKLTNDHNEQKTRELKVFRNCTEAFLPSMLPCVRVLEEAGEEAALGCLHTILDSVDEDGEARRKVKTWMEMGNSWSGLLADMMHSAWTAATG